VEDLDPAGLNRPTGIRRTAVTVDVIEVIGVVGTLGESDSLRVLEAFERRGRWASGSS
jgi:hypothetical protein